MTTTKADEILHDYAQKDSTIDGGNLYYAACLYRNELAALKADQAGHLAREKELKDALQSIFDFIDDGDQPCVGQIVQDGLVANAYVNLVNLIEVAREDTGIATL